MNLVSSILQSIQTLPPFPAVIQRALQLVNDPNTSAQEIVDVIQYEPSITASILKLCNSAYFGLRCTVHSLREAVVMIGFDQLLEIILSLESARFFYAPCKGYDLEEGDLWRHSVGCALSSRIISKRLHREVKPALFTAALLHDIGKMVLSQFIKDYFQEIKKLIRDESLSFTEAEKKVLDIDHAELGGKITEQWHFPKSIVSAVRYHHNPLLASEDQDLVRIVYLSDIVSLFAGLGLGSDGLSYHGHEEVMREYHLREKDLEQFMLLLDDRFKMVNEEILGFRRRISFSEGPAT